jgi:SAM-dependent methyltransferase
MNTRFIAFLKYHVAKSDFLNALMRFNQVNRDKWIADRARQIPAGARVLDAGAGKAPYRELFSHCDYRSQDFCQEPSTMGHYSPMDYVCDINDIPVPDESFDVIVSTEVIEHVPDPINTIKEFSRILKRGGLLLLSAPLGSRLHQTPYFFYGGFSPYWYTHFLPMAGFTNVTVTPNGGFFLFYGQESLRFLLYVFRSLNSRLTRILALPLFAIFGIWFCLLLPLICAALDKIDKDKDCTVGYFVEAMKMDQ